MLRVRGYNSLDMPGATGRSGVTDVREEGRDAMSNGKVIPLFLLMLVAHVAHILEETWGRFWLIDAWKERPAR